MSNKTVTSDFNWQGVNKRGQTIKGTMNAVNMASVKLQLRKQGINPTKIRKASKPLFNLNRGKKVSSLDVAFFTRQMATMIKAGVPLVQSFEIVADGVDKPALKALVYNIRDSVAAGNDFAGTLRKYPDIFDELTCNLVESGEQSGSLENLLDKVATYKEKTESLKRKVKKALVYPAITLIVAFAVTVILLLKVVPTFQEMFSNFDAELPGPTLFVVYISELTQEYWLPVLAVLIATIVVFVQTHKRSAKFRDQLDIYLLKVPMFGELIRKAAVARFSRVLATTFAAGVPLVDALISVSGAVGNALYRDAVLNIHEEVSAGQQLNFAMRNTEIFPNMVVQMASIGEESGALDQMLDKAATYYEDEVDAMVDSLTAMIEPMMMVFLGVVIGGLIIAMYLPIFEMGNAI